MKSSNSNTPQSSFYEIKSKHSILKIKDKPFNDQFEFVNITEGIILGPCPQTKEDIEKLKNEKIDAVLNLQRDEEMIRKMSKYYYDNNRHFKYILYNYGFMISRFDLAFAQEELGYDKQNEIFKVILRGKEALEKILNNLGLSPNSPPMIETFNQHLGLISTSSSEERQQKLSAYRNLYKIQNYYARKLIKEKTIGVDFQESEKKMKILQSTIANISPFNGKGI